MKRGQAWYTDFIVGLLIFLSAITVYYIFQNAMTEDPNTSLEDIVSDAKQIATSLTSPGYPDDWTSTSVERIGLSDGTSRVDLDKVQELIDMDYNATRLLFRTNFNYAIYFYDGNESIILPNNQTYIGLTPTDHIQLVKVTRMMIYNSTLALMEVHLWH